VSAHKRWSYGQLLDFNSVDAATLDRFSYVITARSAVQSQPPPNFHVVVRSRMYEVWHRVGRTPAQGVLPESGNVGAILDCNSPAGRALARRRGVATVRAEPRRSGPIPAILPGYTTQVRLDLPPGRWNLALPYVSPQALRITGGGLDVRLPAYLDRPGTPWPLGRVTSHGRPILLTIHQEDPSFLYSVTKFAQLDPVWAVRADPPRKLPLRRACGHFVDWYVTT
jgi:hypothetical protein